MDTAAFRRAVLAELGRDLGQEDIPLGEIQAFVRRVLELCREHPADVPEDLLKPLIAGFPRFAGAVSGAVKRAVEGRADQEIAAIRKKLSGA